VRKLGLWYVTEYEHFTARTIKVWFFQDFSEAQSFQQDREQFYNSIGLSDKRGVTKPSPEISESEFNMFTKIIDDEESLDHVMRVFDVR
jgi:hypothetical protein